MTEVCFKKCDRCGTTLTGRHSELEAAVTNTGRVALCDIVGWPMGGFRFDLCQPCSKALRGWLKAAPTTQPRIN